MRLYNWDENEPSYCHCNSRGDVVTETDSSVSLSYWVFLSGFDHHGDTASSHGWEWWPDCQQVDARGLPVLGVTLLE